ncbi:MAG: two-component regulator propeller domain-containing protein [Marinoscillum sp.]|uniref:hybrid sensor histidine kinase/response regulator transcription factor n=1 Tax=Marinoscillum sp. TaxID=2024838 RepID=UPI0032F1D620
MLVLTIGFEINGQTEWPLQHVDKKSGLSNSAINAIYMDHLDYVWFGTWDGLNRYDGDEIISYKPIAEDEHSLSNNVVRQILEDKFGNLWIVTHDGINRYNHQLDHFHRYFNDLKDLPFLENNLKATLSEDSTLYISLVGWGVAQYNQQADRFEQIAIDEQIGQNIHSVGAFQNTLYLSNGEGKLYAHSYGKAMVRHDLEWSPKVWFHQFVSLNQRYFYLYQPSSDQLIIKELYQGRIANSFEINTQSAQITGVGSSSDGNQLLLGTDDGQLLEVSLADDQITHRSLSGMIPSLSKRKLKIFSLHTSQQGILWLGTDGDGVYKYLTKERSFYPISEGSPTDGKLSNSIVRSIYIDPNNQLYAGTRSGGLNIISPDRSETRVLNKGNGLNGNTVLSITPDKHGNIWLGLDSEGVDMIEQRTGRILHFPRDFANQPEDLYFGSVYKVFFDAYGHLWLGTSGYGIIYMDIEKTNTGTYQLNESYRISPDQKNAPGEISIRSNIVYTITSEEPNILWFGTRNGGLYRYNTLTRKFTHNLQADETSRYALSNNDILSLYIDQQNKLWVGTSGGLNQVNLSNFTVDQYTQSDGLANNTIHGILQDQSGRLWLSSNNGLFAFSPNTNTFKNFNWTDGLLNYEYTDGAYFQLKGNHQLYFGGTKGIDIVDPNKTDTSTAFPRLAITDLLVSNVRIAPGDSTGILQAHIDLQEEIHLNYDQNFLSLRFTTLDYWHKQRCSYRYFLEGFDNDWNIIGKQSMINLTNIPPGEYQLRLNNSNENGDWNPHERTVRITIDPPFWATNTAYTIYVIMALLSQVGLIQLSRNRAKRKKALEIERLKKEQADTIQKYKLEFFTDIAHEFRTPLTLILGPAVSLLEKTKEKPALHTPIQTIYRNSLRLQKLIQELIQFRKVEMGKEQLNIRAINIIAFTEELLQSFRQYALEKEIILTYEAPEELYAQVDSDILEKILINLISNALKYTDRGGKVAIKLWAEQEKIYFSVKDNGMGIQEHELARVFERFTSLHHEKEEGSTNSVGIGLSLTKKLVNLHHGDISVQSQPGEGTDFTFWLPASLPTQEQVADDTVDHAMLTRLHEHVQAEFYHKDSLDQELINISLERHEHNLLIVDDNIQILNLLKDMLSHQYNVTSCTRAKEALTILASRKIDLVISDVIMPEMSGYELCEAIKTKIEISHVPVILLTAKGQMEERIEGLQAGADAYIPKPFHPDHLKVRIEKLISIREVLKKKFDAYTPHEKEFASFGIGAKDDEFFQLMDQFIKDQMNDPQLDAQHLANHLGMSKTSLYKKVRALTGQTPHALINQYRLKKAAFLLTNSEYNVSEIIYMTGFNSRSYFYKSFQEMFHCSPSTYGNDQN